MTIIKEKTADSIGTWSAAVFARELLRDPKKYRVCVPDTLQAFCEKMI
jgi:hypothetical protein